MLRSGRRILVQRPRAGLSLVCLEMRMKDGVSGVKRGAGGRGPCRTWSGELRMYSESFQKPLQRFEFRESNYNSGPQAKSSMQPAFVTKVWWGHSHVQWFECHLWLLLCCKGRTTWLWQRLYGPQHIKIFTIWPFTEKAWWSGSMRSSQSAVPSSNGKVLMAWTEWLVAEEGGGQVSARFARRADRICWRIKHGGERGEGREESKNSYCLGLNNWVHNKVICSVGTSGEEQFHGNEELLGNIQFEMSFNKAYLVFLSFCFVFQSSAVIFKRT